tara:strand:- start:2336 stop:2479 length:144 start_codon:yes stop_codon:yes gene_type:complete
MINSLLRLVQRRLSEEIRRSILRWKATGCHLTIGIEAELFRLAHFDM